MKSLETAFYASVGMALRGKDKVEKWAKKVVKESKMEAGAGKKFVDSALKHADDVQKELTKQIEDSIKSAANKMGYVTKKEAESLRSEISKLKAQLNKTKKTSKPKK